MKQLSKPLFTLFSCYHKEFKVPDVNYVQPIHAGKGLSCLELGFKGDDEGDNISDLNQYFSELTIVYYVWKNYNEQQLPFWGLCHYRRYFTVRRQWYSPFKNVYDFTSATKAFKNIFTAALIQKINNALDKGKIIMPARYRFIKLKKWSVKQQYIKDHDAHTWNATEAAIEKLYPGYVTSFNEFATGLTCSWYNMLVASWKFWDEYLTWLFAILFEVKVQLEAGGKPVPLRIYGNLSERLLNAYIHHHQKKGQKILYLPISHIL